MSERTTLTQQAADEPAVTTVTPAPAETGLARSAGILGFGNVASRVLGLLRDTIISAYFGSSGQLSAFRLAARVPNMVYDLLVGGMLSAALVPVFSDYARPERRAELARVVSAVVSLIAVVMGVVALLIELFADPFAGVLSSFDDPALHNVVAQSLRVIAPAVLFFGLAGALTGLLYALKRFTYTALAAAVFNLGIVITAPLLAHRLGIYALPLGIVLGSLLQILVLWPGLRDMRLRFSMAWEHPAVQRILSLYVPIALGLIVSEFQQIVDGRWASGTGAQSVAWMGYATVLIQMPLGLVPVAVSLAALPSLSQRAAAGDWETFRRIFARGLRLVLVLLIPATVGLWALAEPTIGLLFQRGAFTAADTVMTAAALRFYLLGLLFAGVDFMLNYTFYARQDTRTPAIVGVIAIGFYFVAALSLMPRYGFLGLVLADSVKQAGHAVLMTILLYRGVGRLGGHHVTSTALKAGVVALVMGVGVWWLAGALGAVLPQGFIGRLLVVGAAGGIGGAFYVGALRLWGVAEIVQLVGAVTKRLRPAR
jgi:putative peptidoglycan lipid II flippase